MTRFRLGPQCLLLSFAVLLSSGIVQRVLWPGQIIDDPWTPALAILLPLGYASAIHPGGRAVVRHIPRRWRWPIRGAFLLGILSGPLDALVHGAITRGMEVVGYGFGLIGLIVFLPIALYLRLTLP